MFVGADAPSYNHRSRTPLVWLSRSLGGTHIRNGVKKMRSPRASSVKNSTCRLCACPLAVVERTIRNRSENRPESNGWLPPARKLVEESDTSVNLQGICRNSCKTLQIFWAISDDLRVRSTA